MRLYKDFSFEAAHRLPNVPDRPQVRPAARPLVSGRVSVDGPVGERSGWVMDFAEVKAAFRPVYDSSTTAI